MHRFQLIIGWPIFCIYYQGRQRSRSCTKVNSNVNFDQHRAPLSHILPISCLLKQELRSWVVSGCRLIRNRQGHASGSMLKWSMEKTMLSKIVRSLTKNGRNVHLCKKSPTLAQMTFDRFLSNPDIGRTFWGGLIPSVQHKSKMATDNIGMVACVLASWSWYLNYGV